MNVNVVKNVSIAATLPIADNFGDNERKAIKIPVVISITPRIFENVFVLRKAKAQEKKDCALLTDEYRLLHTG